MSRNEIIKFLVLRSIGNFLLLFAIFGVFATFGPAVYFEAQYRIIQIRGIKYTVAETPKIQKPQDTTTPLGKILKKRQANQLASKGGGGFTDVLAGPKEQILTPVDTDYSIVIPKIGANSRVISNVDPSDESEFLPILQRGVAHARGTVFPGMNGNIYLFAHSTDNFWDVGRYNAVFYLLKDLSIGDDVVMFFEGKRHNYKVTETKIVDPSDISALTKGHDSSADETLILQTCWPPGTTWKRLLVFAKRR